MVFIKLSLHICNKLSFVSGRIFVNNGMTTIFGNPRIYSFTTMFNTRNSYEIIAFSEIFTQQHSFFCA